MKKSWVIVLLFLFLLSAFGTGCTQGTLPQEDDIAQANYAYGNMQKNLPSGNFMLHDGHVYFFTSDERLGLYSYDLETGKVSSFCTDATCMHNTSKCVARNVGTNLEAYNGELYAMSDNDEIMILKGDSFEAYLDGSIACFWHSGGKLYVETADRSLLVYENGSKNPRTVLDEYACNWNVIYGQYLYGSTGDSVVRVDLSQEVPVIETVVQDGIMHSSMTDGSHIYYMNVADHNYLYRCDLDGSNPTCLLDKGVLSASMNFDDEYLYFRLYTNEELDGTDSTDLYRMSKADPSQVERIAVFPEPVYQVFTVPGEDILFVTTRDNVERQIYTLTTDGSNIQKLEIP